MAYFTLLFEKLLIYSWKYSGTVNDICGLKLLMCSEERNLEIE